MFTIPRSLQHPQYFTAEARRSHSDYRSRGGLIRLLSLGYYRVYITASQKQYREDVPLIPNIIIG